MTRDYVAIIVSICVVAALVGLSTPLVSLLLEERGYPGGVIGLIGATPALASLLGAALLPWTMRHLPADLLLFVGLALTAVGLMPMGLTSSLGAWFAMRFVFGLGLGTVFVITEAWISQIAPEHKRGRLIGLYGTVLALGFAAGSGVLGLTGSAGAAPFIAAGALIVIAVLPLFWLGHAPHLLPPDAGRSIVDPIAHAPDLMLGAAAFGAIETATLTLFPSYGLAHRLSETEAATLLVASGLGNAMLQFPMGWIADHVDRRRLMLGAAAIATLATLCAPYAIEHAWSRLPLMFLSGGAAVALYTVGLVRLGQRFQGPRLASANAAFIAMYCLGNLVGPPLAGWAMQVSRPNGLIAVLAGLCAFHFIVTAIAPQGLSR